MWLALALVLAGLYGCSGDAQRDAKRAQDRSAIQLADAQRQHDADTAQVVDLKAQLQDLQSKNAAATDQNAKLTQEIAQLRDELAAKAAPAAPATAPTN
jgi:predicted RNase H-like nuclease (RuvC/YqgF family)